MTDTQQPDMFSNQIPRPEVEFNETILHDGQAGKFKKFLPDGRLQLEFQVNGDAKFLRNYAATELTRLDGSPLLPPAPLDGAGLGKGIESDAPAGTDTATQDNTDADTRAADTATLRAQVAAYIRTDAELRKDLGKLRAEANRLTEENRHAVAANRAKASQIADLTRIKDELFDELAALKRAASPLSTGWGGAGVGMKQIHVERDAPAHWIESKLNEGWQILHLQFVTPEQLNVVLQRDIPQPAAGDQTPATAAVQPERIEMSAPMLSTFTSRPEGEGVGVRVNTYTNLVRQFGADQVNAALDAEAMQAGKNALTERLARNYQKNPPRSPLHPFYPSNSTT